jgi:peptidoglycan/xylan/chitin deacetylase (PgdA/CDA1 family)
MVYFDWNVSSQDASSTRKSAQSIADNVLGKINNYNNTVVLFHDSSSKDTTVEALPIIIEEILESDDSVFLPISEDTVLVQHLH